jgi:hypothetical protein
MKGRVYKRSYMHAYINICAHTCIYCFFKTPGCDCMCSAVCMCVCMGIHMYSRYDCMCSAICICVCMYACVHTQAHTHTTTHTHTHTWGMYRCMYDVATVCMHVCMYVYTCVFFTCTQIGTNKYQHFLHMCNLYTCESLERQTHTYMHA